MPNNQPLTNFGEIEEPKKSTACVDALTEIAKAQNIVVQTEPGILDVEREKKIKALEKEFKAISSVIKAEKKAEIKLKYNAKKLEISASLPIKKEKFKLERFNSTDEEQYGKDNIKTTFENEMNVLTQGDDKYAEKLKEATEKEEEEKEKAELALAELESKIGLDNLEKKCEEKAKEIEDKLNSTVTLDVNELIKRIGGNADNAINAYADNCYSNLKNHLNNINKKAKAYGDRKGAEMVKDFNNKIRDKAKTQFDKNKETLAKAQTLASQAKISLVLKIGALLGL